MAFGIMEMAEPVEKEPQIGMQNADVGGRAMQNEDGDGMHKMYPDEMPM